jgi:Flp pilus assembly protein TadG
MSSNSTVSRHARRMAARLRRRWQNARRDTHGVAATEFALILPLMLTLYLGSTELTQGVMASRKMTLVSRTVSDLVAQQPNSTPMTDTTMASVFSAATAIMSPFDVSTLKMTVSSVEFVANAATGGTTYNGYDAKVRWSKTGPYGGTARACAKLTPIVNSTSPSPTTLPQGLYASGALIIADVQYTYDPSFGGALLAWSSTDSIMTMKNTTYMRPRNWSSFITYPTQSTGTCLTY